MPFVLEGCSARVSVHSTTLRELRLAGGIPPPASAFFFSACLGLSCALLTGAGYRILLQVRFGGEGFLASDVLQRGAVV